MPRGFPKKDLCPSYTQQQRRHDVDDLDQRIDRRAGGVLGGVADRVAGHGRLVGVRALAAEVATVTNATIRKCFMAVSFWRMNVA
jgi:hypothetical protein